MSLSRTLHTQTGQAVSPPPATGAMGARVVAIEAGLQALDEALAGDASERIEQASAALQRCLGEALQTMADETRAGRATDAELLQRLRRARERVNHQQAAVQRVTAALGRTLDVLLPREQAPATYGALGQSPAAKALTAYR
jgi:hypothetical protein